MTLTFYNKNSPNVTNVVYNVASILTEGQYMRITYTNGKKGETIAMLTESFSWLTTDSFFYDSFKVD